MIRVNLKSFVTDGRFGPIAFGNSREALVSLLGQPEGYGPEMNGRAWWWDYGDVRFGWDVTGNNCLQSIHVLLQGNALPTGGDVIELMPWFARRGESRKAVETMLKAEGIAFDRVREGWDAGFVRVAVGVGVRLTFNEGKSSESCPLGLLGLEYSPAFPRLKSSR
ncbi:MAG TPA: hypothetical protein VF595_17150 [Tepidisphaeraceae bacterium]|jgi:hypothetical protein